MEQQTHIEQGTYDEILSRLEYNRRYYADASSPNKTLSVFADAALQAAETIPEFAAILHDTLELREDLNPAHAVKLLERCFQADLLINDPNYPTAYRELQSWFDAFSAVLTDESRFEMLSYRLLTQRVQSNIAQRYKTVKLLGHLYRRRFGDHPSHLDVGSSLMHGDIMLVNDEGNTHNPVAFETVQLYEPLTDEAIKGFRSGTEKLTPNHVATKLANIALSETLTFGSMTGTDITDIDNPSVKQWVRSCSFYPDELLNPAKVLEYDALETYDPRHERVSFVQADFTDEADVKNFISMTDNQKFDIITYSTVFYQMTSKQKAMMLINSSQLLSDGGIILIQDAPDGNFEKPYNYRSLIKDSTLFDTNTQEILRWKTGRCTDAIIGLGKLSINGKLVSLDKALEERFA